MKRILLFPLLFFAGMTLFACNPSDDAPSAPEMNTPEQSGNAGDSETNEHPENDENEDTPMENNTLKLTVNGRSFTATLVKNSSTEALMKQLAQGSVDIRMDDYGNMEKVGSLGFSLPRNDRQITTASRRPDSVSGQLVCYLLRYEFMELYPLGKGGWRVQPQ